MSTEESTGSVGPTEQLPISANDLIAYTPTPPAPPQPITIDDLLATNQMLLKKEADDKATLEGIGSISHEELKNKLIVWASSGFPNAFEIDRLSINPPQLCSDGVSRDLASYIEFCSGKPLQDHVAVLQAKVTGMSISFANMGNYISIVVTKQ